MSTANVPTWEGPVLDGFSPRAMSEAQVEESMSKARHEGPVAYWPELDAWVVTRYDDVIQVLKDPVTFSSADVYQSVGWSAATNARFADANVNPIGDEFIITMDPPEHTRMRQHLNRVFTPRRVQERESDIRSIVSGCLDQFPIGRPFDIIELLAAPVQIRVIFRMMNIPEEDLEQLRSWVVHLKRLVSGPLPPGEQLECADSAIRLDRYVYDLIERRRVNPTDDFYSDLIQDAAAGRVDWTDAQLKAVISPGLILAGFTTTRNVLGFAIRNLLSVDGAWSAVVRQPDLIPTAIEESLRHSPPMFGFFRNLTRDARVGSVVLPRGGRVVWSTFSANRDERHLSCPAEFRLDRPSKIGHVSFGHGTHFCLGASLARLTLGITLKMLAERYPTLELCRDRPAEPTQGPVARDFERMYVRAPPSRR